MSLQPFEYDPNEKNKHKFMVQSMFAPDGEINQDTLVSDGACCMLLSTSLTVHGACCKVLDHGVGQVAESNLIRGQATICEQGIG